MVKVAPAGGIAAALPFVLKALPFFSAERFAVGDAYSQFTEPSAILSALTTDHLFGVFLFFSLAVPLLESYVPRATWAGAVIIFTGAIWLSGERHFPTSITASLLLGGGLAVLYYALYQRGDLLAVLAAALSSGFVLQMLALTVQPSPALHNTGWLGILLLSGVLIVGVLGVWRGSETPQAFFEPLLILHNRAERERLKADLEVASRAQQQMLPDAPPQLPGFDIAAICTPSKDVGGDLYDFFRRYYHEGDFLSRRVYKPGVYAIPYEGDVPAGRHTIRVSADAMKDWEETVEIQRGQVTPMRIRLRPSPAHGGGSEDFRTVKTMLFDRPDLLHHILDVTARAVSDYLNAQIQSGAQAVMIFDTWGGALPGWAYKEFSLAYLRRIVGELIRQRDGERVPVIAFTKGGGQWLEAIADIGVDAVGLDWTTDLGEARRRVHDGVALQGNLDPVALFASPEAVAREACRVLESFGTHGANSGHVFNLGHGISQFTPPERVSVLVDTVHQFSRRFHGGTPVPAGGN